MNNGRKKLLCLLADFESPGQLLKAAAQMRKAGYTKYDCHSPFPIHGMDAAMGLKRSPLGWIAGLLALGGGAFAFALQWWTSAVDYPIVISGKPFFSFQAYVPVTFALAVLSAAFAATFGMLIINRLPRYHHPLFYSDRFAPSDTGFYISVEVDDPKFDTVETARFLESIGAINIETIEGGE